MPSAQFAYMCSFMLALIGLALHRMHLLSALLCLEGMMLALFVALSLWTFQLGAPNFSTSPLFLLAFSACEAGTGLALMVATARTHSCDHVKMLSLLKC
uniref:NADH-ubiquinone oxidoreductase chain 4L n=1 Tax=Uranoscopus japonicus TaxID=70848 RepID=A0A1V1FHI0_URAJA|nr:NADH dehydrogenase subunit 4L [Uranoscopus japonicus]BAX03820.1 NADH dehydrogenase subunit 4L [Uranoscopus japonicus]BBU26119.1 NADH dehydrogenase subunit 4L [Uranoscopus japonicus]